MQRSIVETAEARAARRCSGMRYIVPFTRSARRSSDAVHRNHSRRRRGRSVPADLAVTDSVTDDRTNRLLPPNPPIRRRRQYEAGFGLGRLSTVATRQHSFSRNSSLNEALETTTERFELGA